MDKYYIVNIIEQPDRNKILDNDYILTLVTIDYKGKIFEGESYCHKNDKYSYVFGGSLAEMRAVYHALQWETSKNKEYYDNLSKFCKSAMQQKNFDKESETAKAIFHQLNIAKKNWIKSKVEKNLTYDAIKEMINEQEKKVARVEELIKRKENEINQD